MSELLRGFSYCNDNVVFEFPLLIYNARTFDLLSFFSAPIFAYWMHWVRNGLTISKVALASLMVRDCFGEIAFDMNCYFTFNNCRPAETEI